MYSQTTSNNRNSHTHIRSKSNSQTRDNSLINGNSYNIIDSLPCIYVLKDIHSNYLNFNQEALRAARLNHKSDVIGKSDTEMPWKEFADRYREQDKQVLKGKELFNIDPTIRADGSRIILLTKKAPVYSELGKIIAVAGVSLELSRDTFHHFFSTLLSSNLAFSNFTLSEKEKRQPFIYGNIEFTKRQAEVIACLLRGHSAGSTGQILKLSKRTVETHIENIKNSLGCQTKVELVNRAFDAGFIELMFLSVN